MPHPSFDHTYQAVVHSLVGATAAGATVDIKGLSSLGIYVSGLTTGTIAPQVSNDAATWSSIPVTNVASNAGGTIITDSGNYRADISGFQYLKMPITDFTTGTITVGINGQPNAGGASSGGGISSGTINAATVNAGTINSGTINIGTVVGNVASGATDSGNPVKVGLVYNATAPTGTTGQRGDAQGDVNFNLKTTLQTQLAGEDLTNDVLKSEQRFSYYHHVGTAGAVNGTVKSGAGFLHCLTLGNHTAGGTYTLFDSIGTSATVIGIISSAGAVSPHYLYDVSFTTGLTVVSGSVCDLTVSYR